MSSSSYPNYGIGEEQGYSPWFLRAVDSRVNYAFYRLQQAGADVEADRSEWSHYMSLLKTTCERHGLYRKIRFMWSTPLELGYLNRYDDSLPLSFRPRITEADHALVDQYIIKLDRILYHLALYRRD